MVPKTQTDRPEHPALSRGARGGDLQRSLSTAAVRWLCDCCCYPQQKARSHQLQKLLSKHVFVMVIEQKWGIRQPML